MRKGKLFSKNNLIQERKRIDFEFFYTDFFDFLILLQEGYSGTQHRFLKTVVGNFCPLLVLFS